MFFIAIGSGTKQAAHRLKILFGLAGLKAAELHGNLTQVQRLDVCSLLLLGAFCFFWIPYISLSKNNCILLEMKF